MSTHQEVEEIYNFIDEFFRLSFGENADLTCALYNGDFSKTLGQAQKDKHGYVLNAINFKEGSKVLDIGCGYGPILTAAQERGGHAIGLTLSTKQAEACKRSGLEVYMIDWNDISVNTFGTFDGIVSLGAFEHFCSGQEYLAGKQDHIYQKFFNLCHELLPEGGRLFLQTMMWGKNAVDYSDYSLKAEKGSNEYLLAVIDKVYSGVWLPFGEEHILRVANPYFELISDNNGRLDYIETVEQWDRGLNFKFSNLIFPKFSFPKLFAISKFLPRFLADKDFHYKMEFFRGSYLKECFKREVLDHQRMVFQKR